MNKTNTIILYTVFFISGTTALIYEVTWMRIFSLLLGSTSLAGTLTLAAFFSGLALGAWLFGRFVDRYGKALLIYSVMEIGLGIYAFFSIQIFNGVDSFSLLLFENTGISSAIVQFPLLWFTLLVPTAIMGGTLPVISKYIARRLDTTGGVIGRLYAINTFGAVAGTVLSAFFMIRVWGISNSIFVSAALNVFIGLFIVILRSIRLLKPLNLTELMQKETIKVDKKSRRSKPVIPPFTNEALFRKLIIIIVFVSGFASLAGEVLWLRIFSISLDSSIQSFGIVLSIFIGGFALGSLVFSKIADKSPQPFLWLSGFFLTSTLMLAILIPYMDRLPLIYFRLIQDYGGQWIASVLVKYGLAASVMLPLTFLLGGIFPVAIRLYTNQISRIGGSVGVVYSWNTVGGILGSIFSGLLFIPVLGTRIGFIVICFLMAAIGYFTFYVASRKKSLSVRFSPAIVLILLFIYIIVLGSWRPERMIVWWGGKKLISSDILYYKEGREGNVAVVRNNVANHLFVGKKLVAADSPETQRHLGLLAHIPLLIHPQPNNVLVIGLATGITLNATLAHHVQKAECVDINPLMKEAAQYFKTENQNVMNKPNVDITIADARHFIRTKENYFDCITTDPIHPADANSNNLYSLEFYQLTASALKKNGIMCQWLPAADLDPTEVRRICATFANVYKYTSLWIPNLADLALIGSNEPVQLDIDLIHKRLHDKVTKAGVARHLGEPTIENFISLFALGKDSLQQFFNDIALNTDDHPILEYEAPKKLWNPGNLPKLYFEIVDHWTHSFDELVGMILANESTDTNIENLRESYYSQRDQTLMLIAESQRLWCLHLEQQGKLQQAIDEYKRMFSLFPETLNPLLLDAFIGISVIYEKLNRSVKAKEFYDAAIGMASSEIESRLIAGEAYTDRNLLDKAEIEWKKVLEIDPTNPEAREHLAWLLLRKRGK